MLTQMIKLPVQGSVKAASCLMGGGRIADNRMEALTILVLAICVLVLLLRK